MSLWNTNVATKESWLRETNKKTEFPCKLTMDGSIFLQSLWNVVPKLEQKIENSKSCRQSKPQKESFYASERNHHQAMLEDVKGERQAKVSKSDVLGRELWEVFLSAFLCHPNVTKRWFWCHQISLFDVTQMSPNPDFDVTRGRTLVISLDM